MNRQQLNHALNLITFDLRRMGSNAEEQTARAVYALQTRDLSLAANVITWDGRLNALRYKVEREVVRTIAMQQPTARDLRRVVAAAHIAIELERMADHATGIARLVLRLDEMRVPDLSADIPRMQILVCDMTRQAIYAFVSHDPALAMATILTDEEVHALYLQTMRVMLTYMMQDKELVQGATYLTWVAHNLKRIGDRAANVCERVLFAEEGELRGISRKDRRIAIESASGALNLIHT
jgi:phosphate transport system protein